MTDLKPNAELAYKVLDHIDAHPQQWDQRHWYGATECGTTACFAGWAVSLAGHDITLSDADPGMGGLRTWAAIDGDMEALIGEVAAADLGIVDMSLPCDSHEDCGQGRSAAGELFHGSSNRESLGDLIEEIFGPRPTAGA